MRALKENARGDVDSSSDSDEEAEKWWQSLAITDVAKLDPIIYMHCPLLLYDVVYEYCLNDSFSLSNIILQLQLKLMKIILTKFII